MLEQNQSPLYDPDFDAPLTLEKEKPGLNQVLQTVPPLRLFGFGVLTSILVLCTIGFFVLLALMF